MDADVGKSNGIEQGCAVRILDRYCWYCHEHCKKGGCPKCLRTFHSQCQRTYGTEDTADGNAGCEICTGLEQSRKFAAERPEILSLLKYTMAKIADVSEFKMLKHWTVEWRSDPKASDPIDLNKIAQKVHAGLYDCLHAFIVDIQSIVHNCTIVHTERHNFTQTAKKLSWFCTDQVQSILDCAGCYKNECINRNGSWRTSVCDQPHLLLWIKLTRSMDFWAAKKGIPYWPAKLLGVVDGRRIRVLFFDDSETEIVPATHCYLYSTTDPSLPNFKADPRDIEVALNEAKLYRESVEKKFGRFVISSKNVRFDCDRYSEHFNEVFLDYAPDSKPPKIDLEDGMETVDGAGDTDFKIAEKKRRVSIHARSDSPLNVSARSKSESTKPATSSSVPIVSSLPANHDQSQDFDEKIKVTMQLLANLKLLVGKCEAQFDDLSGYHLETACEREAQKKEIADLKAKVKELTSRSMAAKSKEVQMAAENANEMRVLRENLASQVASLKKANIRNLFDLKNANETIKTQNDTIKSHEDQLQSVKQTLEQEHKLLVTELKEKHEVIAKLQQIEKDHAQQMVEKERKNQELVKEKAEMESKFERKYSNIVLEIKKVERARSFEENKGKMYCVCGKVFQSKFLCSKQCGDIWKQYLNETPKHDKMDEPEK